ncbi:MAG TPA: HDOD domain-containing protein, partial [Polyangiaceae bacterium]
MTTSPLNRDQILDAVWRTEQLPPYPGIVAEVERELSKPDPAPAKVSGILARDPALCAAILRLANSAAQAMRNETANVGQAIVRLGLRQTRRVVLTAALVQRWPVHHTIDQRSFWSHSISVALMASELSKHASVQLSTETVEATFTAGVLHDLGALVLARAFPEQYALLTSERMATGRSALSLELENWGIDHGEVGGIVACRWRLPDSIRDAVAFHHHPWQASAENRLLTQLVHVADFLCCCQGLNRADDTVPEDFDNTSWDALGLRIEQAHALFEGVIRQGDQSKEWVAALNNGEKDRAWRRST